MSSLSMFCTKKNADHWHFETIVKANQNREVLFKISKSLKNCFIIFPPFKVIVFVILFLNSFFLIQKILENFLGRKISDFFSLT